jgi:hypothetical protein
MPALGYAVHHVERVLYGVKKHEILFQKAHILGIIARRLNAIKQALVNAEHDEMRVGAHEHTRLLPRLVNNRTVTEKIPTSVRTRHLIRYITIDPVVDAVHSDTRHGLYIQRRAEQHNVKVLGNVTLAENEPSWLVLVVSGVAHNHALCVARVLSELGHEEIESGCEPLHCLVVPRSLARLRRLQQLLDVVGQEELVLTLVLFLVKDLLFDRSFRLFIYFLLFYIIFDVYSNHLTPIDEI